MNDAYSITGILRGAMKRVLAIWQSGPSGANPAISALPGAMGPYFPTRQPRSYDLPARDAAPGKDPIVSAACSRLGINARPKCTGFQKTHDFNAENLARPDPFHCNSPAPHRSVLQGRHRHASWDRPRTDHNRIPGAHPCGQGHGGHGYSNRGSSATDSPSSGSNGGSVAVHSNSGTTPESARSYTGSHTHAAASGAGANAAPGQYGVGAAASGCGNLSIYRVFRPVIYTDIRPPWGVVSE